MANRDFNINDYLDKTKSKILFDYGWNDCEMMLKKKLVIE